MAKAKMLVFSAAAEGQRERLDQWYDERHIPDLLKVPGLVAAERYDLQKIKVPEGCPDWDFLAVYSLEGDDVGTILKAMGARMGTPEMPADRALDSSKTLAYLATDKGDTA